MTFRRPLGALVISLALAAAGACGDDPGKDEDTQVTTETSAPGEMTEGTAATLKARLSGAEEAPAPGVKDGVGAFQLDVAGGKGCYDLSVTMGEKPTQAHIHQGAKGDSGPVVVDLNPTFEPGEAALAAKSCVELAPDVVTQLIADPGGYYVNVHSDAHPDGAMRGQLEKS